MKRVFFLFPFVFSVAPAWATTSGLFPGSECAEALYAKSTSSKRLGFSRYLDLSRFDSRTPEIWVEGEHGAREQIFLFLKPYLRDLNTQSPSARVVGYDTDSSQLYVSLEKDWYPSGSSKSTGQILVFVLAQHRSGELLAPFRHVTLPKLPALPQVQELQPRETYYSELARDATRIRKVVSFMDGSALLVGWRFRGVQAVGLDGRDLAPHLFAEQDALARAIVQDQSDPAHSPPHLPEWEFWKRTSGGWAAPLLDARVRLFSFAQNPDSVLIRPEELLK